MEALRARILAKAEYNNELLETINDKRKDWIITGYTYSLECNLPRPSQGAVAGTEAVRNCNNNTEVEFHFHARPTRNRVYARLNAWRYSGSELQTPPDIFNDQIRYELRTFADVKRLNAGLPIIAQKFCRLADTYENRAIMQMLLANLQTLRAAIRDLLQLTNDVTDMLSGNKDIAKGMDMIAKGFDVVKSQAPSAALSIKACEKHGQTRALLFW